jgi:D-threo-aldose 1-dehydrogenase
LNDTLREVVASIRSSFDRGRDVRVPYEPFVAVRLGSTDVEVTRLGFGSASIGGLFRAVDDDSATRTIDRAWELGIRYFDVAPLYGYGTAERRLGTALARRPRHEYVLSTKVGRLVRPTHLVPPGADVDRQALDGREDAYYADTAGRRIVFDYSTDGVLRSLEESLERLGADRIDLVLIHDPDDHWEAAIDGAYPALHRLREQGVVGAIGVGMNQSAMLARFAREAQIDAFLVAGRYTLLDQDALSELMPLCVERGISVLIGGAMNSGVLADPRPGAHFNYRPIDPVVLDRARRLATICERHGVPLRAAAIQFPLAHPAVAGLIAGVRTVEHLDEYPELMRRPIPPALWDELRADGSIAPDAPVPS